MTYLIYYIFFEDQKSIIIDKLENTPSVLFINFILHFTLLSPLTQSTMKSNLRPSYTLLLSHHWRRYIDIEPVAMLHFIPFSPLTQGKRKSNPWPFTPLTLDTRKFDTWPCYISPFSHHWQRTQGNHLSSYTLSFWQHLRRTQGNLTRGHITFHPFVTTDTGTWIFSPGHVTQGNLIRAHVTLQDIVTTDEENKVI